MSMDKKLWFDGPMQVALDTSSIRTPQLSGISQYTLQLLKALGSEQVQPVMKISRFRNFRVAANILERAPRFYHPKTRLGLGRFDVFHGPDFRVPEVRSIAKIVTVHDLAEFESDFQDPEFARIAQSNMRHLFAASQPDMIIAVSDFTKQKIESLFPMTKGRVVRIYHGADHLAKPVTGFSSKSQSPQWRSLLNSKFVLFVGTIEKRKNISRLYEAFIHSALPALGYRLVLAGANGFGGQEIVRSINHPSVEILGYTEPGALAELYTHASFFCFPSLYEGFGFPVLEAMGFGLPIVTSQNSACSEICGRTAMLVDPLSVSSLRQAMETLAARTDLRQSLRVFGLHRFRQFTWAKCAEETQAAYAETLLRFKYDIGARRHFLWTPQEVAAWSMQS
ncbi:MAG: glycosyltransferase family 4 protein, partial [Bdellovibrio sp.]